jgi:hypothetical protein
MSYCPHCHESVDADELLSFLPDEDTIEGASGETVRRPDVGAVVLTAEGCRRRIAAFAGLIVLDPIAGRPRGSEHVRDGWIDNDGTWWPVEAIERELCGDSWRSDLLPELVAA